MGKRQAIRMGKWKAVRLNVANPEKTKTELYDLSVDPYEKSDVSATNPEIMKKMELLFTTARTGKALK
jgi:arylsulfatase